MSEKIDVLKKYAIIVMIAIIWSFGGIVTGTAIGSVFQPGSASDPVKIESCSDQTCDGPSDCKAKEDFSCVVHDNSCTSGCCYTVCED